MKIKPFCKTEKIDNTEIKKELLVENDIYCYSWKFNLNGSQQQFEVRGTNDEKADETLKDLESKLVFWLKLEKAKICK